MDGVESYITVTVVIIGAVGVMIIILNSLHAVVSNRRMYRMMLTCGIDKTNLSECRPLHGCRRSPPVPGNIRSCEAAGTTPR